MSLTVAIVVFVLLAVALIGVLAFVMQSPRGLRRHRSRGGRPMGRFRVIRRVDRTRSQPRRHGRHST